MKKVLLVHHLPDEWEATAINDVEQVGDLMDIIEDAPGKLFDLNDLELLIYFPEATWDEVYDDFEIELPSGWVH